MSLDRLAQIAATCPDADNRRFLVDALRKLDAGLPADQALDLCGSGAKRERDKLLRLAAAVIPGTPTARAKAIADTARRLDTRQPRDEIEQLIVQAGSCCRVPGWRQVFTIIATVPEETACTADDTDSINMAKR
jgi:hypothetical protein